MKNKFVVKFLYAISVVLLSATEFAFATDKSPEFQLAMKSMITNFTLAMLGIVFFIFIIYFGLTVYNKFFVSSQIKDYKLSKDSLRTPRDKDEAILMFITKNRLK